MGAILSANADVVDGLQLSLLVAALICLAGALVAALTIGRRSEAPSRPACTPEPCHC